MGSLLETRLDHFLDALASGDATPGGGAAAALSAAAGAALVSMVCNLTIGRPKFAAVEATMTEILAEAEACRIRLQRGIDDDAVAYDAVIAALRLPKETPAQAGTRTEAVQQALRHATEPPFAIAEDAVRVLGLCRRAVEVGNPRAISDVAVAAWLARAGLESAAENVEINLAALRDESFIAGARERLRNLVDPHVSAAAEVRQRAHARSQ